MHDVDEICGRRGQHEHNLPNPSAGSNAARVRHETHTEPIYEQADKVETQPNGPPNELREKT